MMVFFYHRLIWHSCIREQKLHFKSCLTIIKEGSLNHRLARQNPKISSAIILPRVTYTVIMTKKMHRNA